MESLKVSKRLGWTLLEGRGKKHAENVQIPGTEWTWHDNIHDNVIQWLFLGRFFFEHFGGWGVFRLVFVCVFFVQVVVGWRSFDNVFRCFHVWRVAEFANVGIVESEETRVTRENGREYSIGRVPAKCHFLIFQKTGNILYFIQVAKMYPFCWPGKYWGNVEKSYPLFLGRRTMLQKMPSWESKLAMHWCSCCQWYVWCGLGAGIVCFCLFGSQIACLLRSNYTWVGYKKI